MGSMSGCLLAAAPLACFLLAVAALLVEKISCRTTPVLSPENATVTRRMLSMLIVLTQEDVLVDGMMLMVLRCLGDRGWRSQQRSGGGRFQETAKPRFWMLAAMLDVKL